MFNAVPCQQLISNGQWNPCCRVIWCHHLYHLGASLCACHANTWVPGDRGQLTLTRPVILSTWLFGAFAMVVTFRWLFTCDIKVHCAYSQMFIHMSVIQTPVPDLLIFSLPYCWRACRPLAMPMVYIYFYLGQLSFSHKMITRCNAQSSAHYECFSLLLLFKAINAMPVQQTLSQPGGELWRKYYLPECPTLAPNDCVYMPLPQLVSSRRLPKENWDLKLGGFL